MLDRPAFTPPMAVLIEAPRDPGAARHVQWRHRCTVVPLMGMAPETEALVRRLKVRNPSLGVFDFDHGKAVAVFPWGAKVGAVVHDAHHQVRCDTNALELCERIMGVWRDDLEPEAPKGFETVAALLEQVRAMA